MILLICIQSSSNERDELIKLLVKEISNNRFDVKAYYLVVYNSALSYSKELENIQNKRIFKNQFGNRKSVYE